MRYRHVQDPRQVKSRIFPEQHSTEKPQRSHLVKKLTSRDKAELIAQLAAEKKGQDIVLMDMRKVSVFCDWFVIVSVPSSRRLNAVSRTIEKELSKKKVRLLHEEGKGNMYWDLLDYGDVIVHIFYREVRDFYGLERLWSDASVESFDEKCLAKTSQKDSRTSS